MHSQEKHVALSSPLENSHSISTSSERTQSDSSSSSTGSASDSSKFEQPPYEPHLYNPENLPDTAKLAPEQRELMTNNRLHLPNDCDPKPVWFPKKGIFGKGLERLPNFPRLGKKRCIDINNPKPENLIRWYELSL